MDDLAVTPGRQDGMAAFRGPRGTTRVVRNHEVRGHEAVMGGSPSDIAKAYDGNTNGGTTTLSIDSNTRELLGS